MRQVPNNTKKAKIYLSGDNVSTLDKQLQETYGESLNDISRAETDVLSLNVTLRKVNIEPLVIKKVIQKFVPSNEKKKSGQMPLFGFHYTPDFLIRKKNSKSLIVEVKGKPYCNEAAEKEMRKLEKINPNKLKYELLLLEEGESIFGKVAPVVNWIYKKK